MLNVPAMQGAAARRRAAGNWWETDPALFGWWPFFATANDASGNGNHGALQADAAISGTPAALQLDGTGDFVLCPANMYAQSQTRAKGLSLCVWANSAFTTSTTINIPLIGASAASGNTSLSAGGIGYWRGTAANVEVAVIFDGGYKSANPGFSVPANMLAGTWYFLAGVVDPAGEIRVYRNGTERAKTAITISGVTLEPNRFVIGGGMTGSNINGYWTGSISNAFGFGRLLSQQEIAEIYHGTKSYYGIA